ncbi:MAG: hypothetical protein IJA84_08105 [Clostridia bacterium]|nr:hypothetical protein [Clostridia bacterium]
METVQDWRFCAVGNIVAQHTDEAGQVFYGTKAFSGGTKVYIEDKTWSASDGSVAVIGLNRFGRYAVESVPKDLIEHIRMQRVFKPVVLRIMAHQASMDGWVWRGRTAADRKALRAFVEQCNKP